MRWLAFALLVGCGATPPPIPAADYPYTLRPPSDLPQDFTLRQQVEARFQGRTERFEAVLQKQGDTLVFIGFTPFGTKAFALKQTGTELTYRSYLDQDPPFPPRFILVDVQRALWPQGHVAQEEVAERRDGDRLVQRRFRRERFGDRAITVRYGEWRDGVPRVIELENGWFGYALTITVVE